MSLLAAQMMLNNYWWFAVGVYLVTLLWFGLFYTPINNDFENKVVGPVVLPLLLGIVGPFFLILFLFLFPFLLMGAAAGIVTWFLYKGMEMRRNK